MAEERTHNEYSERLQLMASGDNQWDLTDNDCASIQWALDANLKLAEALRTSQASLQEICGEEDLSLRVKPELGYCLSKGASDRMRSAIAAAEKLLNEVER